MSISEKDSFPGKFVKVRSFSLWMAVHNPEIIIQVIVFSCGIPFTANCLGIWLAAGDDSPDRLGRSRG